jgi:hypothetical protein
MRVGLLWRQEWDPYEPGSPVAETRLQGMFAAFAELGVAAEPIVYSDREVEPVRNLLLQLDGVLVWVNPIEQGLNRFRLDALLQEAVDAGVFVSARPDVILRMGTKEVLWDTREMSWSCDVALYRSGEQLRTELPGRLAGGPRVLKQHRGMGGDGVWRVEAAGDGQVVVQHALGGPTAERLGLEDFVARCERYFDDGLMVEQPYQPRLADGMIRAYLTHDQVVGFTHQYPRGLMPPGPDRRPSGKAWEPPEEPRFQRLRDRLEREWVSQLERLVGLTREDLPVIWDADFLLGPKSADGEDTYILCEINCSSTFAFPDFAMPAVARKTLERIGLP